MRGFGPVSESQLMDKASGSLTRDISKVIRYINLEKDDAKKRALMNLYHTAKFFVDKYDGCDEVVRERPVFAREFIMLWTMFREQSRGRKLLLVVSGGITTGPNCHYYNYWCAVRGITEGQIALLDGLIDRMRRFAEDPTVTIESVTNEDDDDDDDEDDEGDEKGDIERFDVADIIDIEDNIVTKKVAKPTVTQTVAMVETIVDEHVGKPGLSDTFGDSGLNPSIESFKKLPKPKPVTKVQDTDGFSDSSSDWFDVQAAKLLSQSTPAEIKGKITIEIKADYDYRLLVQGWKIPCQFSDLAQLQRFLSDTIRGPKAPWFDQNGNKLKEPEKLFPHFDLTMVTNDYSFITPVQKSTYRTKNSLAPQRVAMPRRRSLEQIGRQKAIVQTPNLLNNRLHGQQSSRNDLDEPIQTIDSDKSVLESQVLELSKRIQELEKRYKN